MTTWNELRIGKVVDLQQGLCINSKSKHLLAEKGYPLLRITDLINNTKIQFIDPNKVPKKFLTTKKDLIYTRTGQVGLVFRGKEGIVHNNCFTIQTNSEVEADYLYYFLKSDYAVSYAHSVASGAAQPDLAHDSFKSMYFRYPKNKTAQKKIAAILYTYDNLIENNKRRIALLEKMAEEIYREWFVRFRVPGYQDVEFEKGVPKAWVYDFAESFFSVVKGKSYTSDEMAEVSSENMPFINLKSFNRGGGYREDGLKFYSGRYNERQIVKSGDVVMAVTDMTQSREVVGRVARIPDIGEKGAVISLDVIKIFPKTVTSTFIYSFLKYSGFADFIKSFANGANVLHLKPDLVTAQKIVMPPKDIRSKYDELVIPIYLQIDNLSKLNISLIETRNRLLPRLISGKLSVEDLDIKFPPSMLEEKVS